MIEVTTEHVAARLRAAGCVWAQEEAEALLAASGSRAELERLVARRVAGEPLEHVVGWADFADVRVRVAPGVFVPRHRSEHLVHVAAEWIRAWGSGVVARRPSTGGLPGLTVLDLCAGSGALGLALHQWAGPFRLVATDVDPVAVACAAGNIAAVGGTAFRGDLFDAVPERLRGQMGLIVANAPYVPSDQVALMPHEARDHEPAAALDGGHDGLMVHRRLLAAAPGWLAGGGAVLVEVADSQAAAAAAIVRRAGLDPIVSPSPDDRRTVVVGGQLWAGSSSGPDLASGK